MISTNEFRTGQTIEWENGIWTIVDFQHVKPGKGAAFVRARLKNVITGNVNETTFRAGEKMAKAQIDYRDMQFLYESSGEYFFMDQDSFEQMSFQLEVLKDVIKYLKEDMVVQVSFYNNSPIGVDLPNFVELVIVETDPGLKGDTASGGTKPAKLETGAVVQVPLFIQQGEKVKVDTRTHQYLERC